MTHLELETRLRAVLRGTDIDPARVALIIQDAIKDGSLEPQASSDLMLVPRAEYQKLLADVATLKELSQRKKK